MSNLLTRRFSNREKALILVLAVILVIGLYVLLVHYPVTDRIQQAEYDAAEVEDEIAVAQARLAVYNGMKAELDEIFAMPPEDVTVLPAFDNVQNLMNMFNDIFAGTDPSLSFSNVQEQGKVAVRPVQFSFTATSYAHARQVLTALTGTGCRCLLDGLTFAPVDGDVESGALRVSGNITFYELDETGAAVPAA